MMLLPMVASADAVEIDGIYYNLIKGKIAEVTTNPDKYSGEVIIPSTVTYNEVEYSVKSIGVNAFRNSQITVVEIPSSITSINSGAFAYCSYLVKVIVKDIDAWCRINFQEIESNPLNGNSGLGFLYSDYSTKIEHLVIPNSVSSIGDYAFVGCSSITSVEIEGDVTSIGDYAFGYCDNLTSVNLPNSVNHIGKNAFFCCYGLTSINIPYGITEIEDGTFNGCTSLTTVNLPNSVTTIGSSGFRYCTALASIIIPNSVTSIKSEAFWNCTELTSITIPNGVTTIKRRTFADCSKLKTAIVGNGVTKIEENAFYGCTNLSYVSIGSNISIIGTKAFKNCGELSDVYCYAEDVPTTSSDAFDSSYPEYITLHVPESSIDAYKDATPWSNFLDVVALSPSINVSVTSAKYATFCDAVSRDFSASGITVYSARANDNSVSFYEVTDGIVPPNTGVVLYSATEINNVAIPLTTASSTHDYSSNEMIGVNVGTTVALDGVGAKKNYILANGGSGVGFYKAKAAGAKLAAHKAYLSTATAAATAREFLGFDDSETTALESIIKTQKADGQYYNLNGQRVAQPTKGLYIVNGKKVIIK